MKTPTLMIATTLLVAVIGGCTSESGGPSRTTAMVAFDPHPTLLVSTKVGESIAKDIAVSGRDRLEVPDTRNWSCGSSVQENFVSNVAWLELVNGSPDTVGLSIELEGLANTYPKLFVYERQNVALSECLTLGLGRKLEGTSSVILEPSSSVYLLLSAGAVTGVYTLTVKTDAIIAP